MNDNPNLERGKLLYEQNRYEQAVREFQQALTHDPENDEALIYQAHALLQLDRHTEALNIADALLGRTPDGPHLLDLKARILLQLDRPAEALRFIEEAIQLDPNDDDLWSTACAIHYDQKDFDKALDAAETGLRINPGNTICRNLRTLCLTKLHRESDIQESINDTLAEDPGDAFSHASAGWALLEKGDHQPARTHFVEALRIAPGLKWAESGLLQAIKAKNPVYRFFLKYYFWMASLKGQSQWAVLIGSYIGLRYLNSIENPNPLMQVAKVVLLAFVWLTWFVEPIFNVLMLTDRDGRHLLSDRQRQRYPYVGALFGFGLPAALIGYFAESQNNSLFGWLFLVGLMGLGLVLPLSGWIEVDKEKNRTRMRWVFGLMAVTAGLSAVLLLVNNIGLVLFSGFMIELVLFMLLRNFLLIQEDD